MTSNKKLLQAWKNLDIILKKDGEQDDDYVAETNDYYSMAKTTQSLKTSYLPVRPQSSYVGTKNRPMLTMENMKTFVRSPMTANTSSVFGSKFSPASRGGGAGEKSGLVQMFSPKSKLFDENTVLHSISVQELKLIYEKKCVDNRNEFNMNQLNYFLDRFDKTCKKKVFNMEDQYIGPNSAVEIARLLANNMHFININLSRNSIFDIGAKNLAYALRQNSSIIHLDLSNNGIGHEGAAELFAMLAENETLISLKLNSLEGLNRNRIDARGMKPLAFSLKRNQILEFLDISGSCITVEGATYLAMGLEHNKSLLSLNVAENDLGPKCQVLVKAIGTCNLLELNLANNKLGDAGLQVLLGIFQPGGVYQSRLQILDISENGITAYGAIKLFDVLAKNNTLKKLILDHNAITGRGISNIITLLWENPVIMHLSLYDCDLNHEGADALGVGLARNFHVESLVVGKNPFKDEGAKLLATALKDNSSLKVLDLSCCKIREEGGKAIAELIKTNHNITHVDLRDNHLNDEAGIALSDAVKLNKKLAKLNLDRNLTSYKYVLDIQRSIKSNSQELTKEAAGTFVKEMEYLKAFEAQKHIVAQEGKVFGMKEKEVKDELDFYNDLMNQASKEAGELKEELENEYVYVCDQVRNAERERNDLEDALQQAKTDTESQLRFFKNSIDDLYQDIDELARENKKIKESIDQSKIHYERQIAKLKTEIADRERLVVVLESTVTSTENQVNKLKEEKAAGSKSPGKSPSGKIQRSGTKAPTKKFTNYAAEESQGDGQSDRPNPGEAELAKSTSSFKLQAVDVEQSPEKANKPLAKQKTTKAGIKANPKVGKGK